MTRKIIAASIGYLNPSTSPQGNILYVATEDFTTDSGDTPALTYFQGRLEGDIQYNWRVSAPFTGTRPVAGLGALKITNNDGGLDAALDWEFRDGAVSVRMLDPGQDFADGTVIATAIVERAEFSDQTSLRLVLRDPAAILDTPIQQSTFTLAQAPDAENKLRPYSFGTPLSVDPVLVDKSIWSYHVHDQQIVEVGLVRDNGLEIPFLVTEYGFTLNSAPSGKITADPISTGVDTLSVLDDSAEGDGAILSNLNRTIQNPFRTFQSPKLIDITSFSVDGRAASAGGKYYFEVYIEQYHANATGPDFPDALWASAAGIGATQPTNGHRINNSDEYAIWLTSASAAAGTFSTWEDGSEIDNNVSGGLGGSVNWEGVTLGILVNFDDMEMSFRVNGTAKGSTLSISANSPLDTFYPLVAVAGNGNTDTRDQDNKVSLYLHDENFDEDLPIDYESWSGSAYAEATSWTDLVTSITDKVSGLTVDTVTQAQIDAIGYSYSYYLKDSRTAARVLFEACASHSGWYYINREGKLTFGRLVEPADSGVTTFTVAEIITMVNIGSDYAPGLSNRMGALKNWHQLNLDSINTSLAEDIRVALSDPFQHEATSDVVPASGYNHALGGEILPTYFRIAGDANTEIERLMTLYTQERHFLVVDVVFDLDQFELLDLGATVSLVFDRYGFDSVAGAGDFSSGFSDGFDLGSEGSQYLLLGIEGNFVNNKVRLTLWG